MKITFRNYSIKDLIENGVEIVPYPLTESDQLNYRKIRDQDFEVEIHRSRYLPFHRKFFALIRTATENGILDHIPGSQFNELDRIDGNTIRMIGYKFKDETETFLYILKWLFLPLIETVYPDGSTHQEINSISFQKMDQDTFSKFYHDTLTYTAYKLGVKPDELEKNILY